MAEQDLQALAGQPAPPVAADGLRRVWSFPSENDLDTKSQGGTGISIKLLAEHCEPHANVLAVYFRVVLLQILRLQGPLRPWQDGNNLYDSVFELAARFPLPRGAMAADFDAFIAELRR
jgi:hypothetical protein